MNLFFLQHRRNIYNFQNTNSQKQSFYLQIIQMWSFNFYSCIQNSNLIKYLHQRMYNICLSLILVVLAKGIITPQDFITMAGQAEKSGIYARGYNLSRTVNNNQLTIFTITKFPYSGLDELKGRQAILINSYMHAREPYSLQLAFELYQNLIKNKMIHSLSTFLQKGVIIFYPFVNIDGYKQYTKSNSIKQEMRKNMNRNNQNCPSGSAGVDINRNFDSSFGSVSTSRNPCSQQYRGLQPFSEKQSQVFRQVFNSFRVVLAIDIHSYGNQWIYPYASDASQQKIKKHSLYNIYTQVVGQLINQNFTIRSCFESLNYIADGVYIDWALDQGAFSLAYEVGKRFSYDSNIEASIQKSLKQFDIVFEFLGAKIEGKKVGQLIKLTSKSLTSLQISVTFETNVHNQTLKPGQIKYISIPRDSQKAVVSMGDKQLLYLEFSPQIQLLSSIFVILLVLVVISLIFFIFYRIGNTGNTSVSKQQMNFQLYQKVKQANFPITVTQIQF